MKPIGCLPVILLLAGCAAFQTSGQVQAGRQALLINDPSRALGYFQQAAERSPDYIFESQSFRQSVWTYLGRAQYATGRLKEARQSFEKALSIYRYDDLARLYFGLTLARLANYSEGVKSIESGMKGLHEWLEYMEATSPFTAFWDPLRQIRSELEKGLQMISGKEIDWHALIATGEWVGREMEQEIDRVRRDERRFFRDREFHRRGLLLGLDLSF